MLPQDTTHLIPKSCYQRGSPCQDPAGNWTTRRPDHGKESQAAVVWSCLPFIRSGRNHLARHNERGKKTRQTEEEVGRRQVMNRPGVRQDPEGSGEQGKMEETGCEIICDAPTIPAVNGQMRWWWVVWSCHPILFSSVFSCLADVNSFIWFDDDVYRCLVASFCSLFYPFVFLLKLPSSTYFWKYICIKLIVTLTCISRLCDFPLRFLIITMAIIIMDEGWQPEPSILFQINIRSSATQPWSSLLFCVNLYSHYYLSVCKSYQGQSALQEFVPNFFLSVYNKAQFVSQSCFTSFVLRWPFVAALM